MTKASEGSKPAAPYGRALWDAEKKAALFAEVAKTTEIAKRGGVLERPKTGKSDKTMALYARLSRSRVDVSAKNGGRLMEGVTSQSWHTTKAAVLHRLATEYRHWRQVGDKALDFGEAVEAAQRARYAVVAFEKVTAMQRPPR